jgi:hypothetical protein
MFALRAAFAASAIEAALLFDYELVEKQRASPLAFLWNGRFEITARPKPNAHALGRENECRPDRNNP